MDAGTAAVRRPYELRQLRQQGIPRITIFHIPSFQDCTGWTVYLLRGGKDYRLQRVTWQQTADSQRIGEFMRGQSVSLSSEPTLAADSRPLDASWFERQFTALMTIRIPLHTNRPIGLDGESFGVHARNEFEVEWWCDGPTEWRDLIKSTNECIEYFQQSTVA